MASTPDANQFAVSMLHLLQRFTGNQPDALKQMRKQVENELEVAREAAARAEAQLVALDQLESLIETTGVAEPVPTTAPSLKKAIVAILDEQPERLWFRDELFNELLRRGWGPGGGNPRNTYTSRLRDLEKEGRLHRVGRDGFTSLKGVGND
jgi:hypothetical protein